MDSTDDKEASKRSPYDEGWRWPFTLFFSEKFSVHRVLGLAYLMQYCSAWYLYNSSYPTFLSSFLIWSLPLNGVIQSLTATYYFSFLPRKVDPGYYSDKAALSYDFVKVRHFLARAHTLVAVWSASRGSITGGSPSSPVRPSSCPLRNCTHP
jgi:hypothetical protein